MCSTSPAKAVNGWRIGLGGGDAASFNGDWLKRAAVAKAGIYANDPIEAAYPFARTDDRGRPLDGKSKYTLTFPADGLPPVNAFWSVTMYDGKTQLLVKNPIDRYLINSPMLPDLKKNPDGSITIISRTPRPARTRKRTGCRRRKARSISSCASTGRRRPRPRSCRSGREPGSRPG